MRELPTGTVTFMFSDIEGSTRLLQSAGDDYPRLLERHAALVREATSACEGIELSTEGDSFFVVFRSPARAVDAAVQAQRALQAEAWPAEMPVKVRMGIHTGEGILGGDNYAGLDVNRASRVAAAAHGGQVLLSGATRGLVEHRLPDGVSLRDLGTHRLKDLAQPEHLHQLVIEGLIDGFPPPRTLDARPNNLPAPATRFIPRPDVERDVRAALSEARLLTLTGPGGTGKTRLAIAVAMDSLLDFGDGAFFVDLSALTDSALVATTIREALGVPEDPQRPSADTLAEHLREREMLLVLDNFEQVTDAASVVAGLLQAAPKLKVLVTSRVPLHLYGEREFGVPPLVLPDPADLPDAETTSQYESVALFIDRATGVKPDFRVTNDNAPAVAEICYRLDGLPLAIELAASRIKLLSPEAMLPRLQRRLQLASAGARDLPERQRTLRGAIEWSHDLLDDADRRLFARLAAFMGGATLEAVERVCDPERAVDVLDALASLVDKSLLRQVESEGEPRFVMLETIREYALERLGESGEGTEIRGRHAEWVAELAEEAEPHLTGERQLEWLARCDREHDNVRAALRWSVDAGRPEPALRITGALWRFWQQRGHLREGLRWVEEVLDAPGSEARTEARARAHTSAGGLAYWMNDYATARRHYETALDIRRELGSPGPLAEALYNLSYLFLIEGDHDTTRELLQDCAERAREAGDELLEANASTVLGYENVIRGDPQVAVDQAEHAVRIFRKLERRFELADGLTGLAEVYQVTGRLEDATETYREALRMFVDAGNLTGIETVTYAMATLAVVREDPERAVRLMGADAALRERGGGGAPPEILNQIVGDPLELGRAALPPDRADAAFEEGRAMSTEELVAYALGEGDDGGG